ncbi:helix-turn-helix transcriptional regulator [Vagococcus fluvialis]|uniref:helix-turn-helix domain-containing protein n=1 Tax=Vagococcus fluvialis TaxID=2738 RepID=UPI00288DB38E|nr:helix-turn-helix transcriptional regulator [Vagococcus fluvialis]MDT2781420.1 helix-turn-helix transcriptional regulator [Vagococcus fluvialis]
MTTFERIKELAKRRGKSLNKIEEELGYGKNVLYRLKDSNPSAERLEDLADYFNVSVDYLLGREEKEQQATESLDEMIDNAMFYDGKPLSDTDREIVKAFLEGKFGSK